MDNIEVAQGLRAYAEFLEQHPEIKAGPSIALYPGSGLEIARRIWANLPSPTAIVEPEHDLSTICQKFGPFTVCFHFSRASLAQPRITDDGNIVWDLRSEFQPVTEVVNA